jgi:hypothetical protein
MKKYCSLLCLGLLIGCGGGAAEEGGYIIRFTVKGSPTAFDGRVVTVQGKRMSEPFRSTTFSSSEVYLCTNSVDRFINDPVLVRVSASDQLVSETKVNRVGCRFREGPLGPQEHNLVYLEDDGTISADFGSDDRLISGCTQPNARAPYCVPDDLASPL